jgi:hypothetical protein
MQRIFQSTPAKRSLLLASACLLFTAGPQTWEFFKDHPRRN